MAIVSIFTKRVSPLLPSLLLSLYILAPASQYPDYTLALYSSGFFTSPAGIGHAFMVIKVMTAHGVKEEAFGFYPEPEATAKDIPRVIVGTPGALHKEFDRHPERFPYIEDSLEIPI